MIIELPKEIELNGEPYLETETLLNEISTDLKTVTDLFKISPKVVLLCHWKMEFVFRRFQLPLSLLPASSSQFALVIRLSR